MAPSTTTTANNLVPHYLQVNASSIPDNSRPGSRFSAIDSYEITRGFDLIRVMTLLAAGFFNLRTADHEYPEKD